MSEKKEIRLTTGQAIVCLVVLMIALGGVLYLILPDNTGDQTRPAGAEGKAYIDLDQINPEDTVVKFDDKWWYVNKTSGELELIEADHD